MASIGWPWRLILGLVVFAFLAGTLQLGALTPQNQCPGDCSPCLGDDDPFCPHGDEPDGGTGPGGEGSCQWCKPDPHYGNRPVCDSVEEGESGFTNCTMVWVETTPVSCSTQGGYYCAYIVVTP